MGRVQVKSLQLALIDEYENVGQNKKQAMLTAIKILAGRNGPTTREDERDVDLFAYLSTVQLGAKVPADVHLTRFTCKGFLNKVTDKASSRPKSDRYWFVFNLQTKNFQWFNDKREMNFSVLGTIPMKCISKVIIAPGANESNTFFIATSKRSYQLRAVSVVGMKYWASALLTLCAEENCA